MVDAKSVISISPDAKVAIISAMLKHPDDLSTLNALRQKLIREKAIVDQQLKIGVQNQMEETKEALDILGTTKEQVLGVRSNMKNIDSLCKDAQGLITDYPRIRKVLIISCQCRSIPPLRAIIVAFSHLTSLIFYSCLDLTNAPKLCRGTNIG